MHYPDIAIIDTSRRDMELDTPLTSLGNTIMSTVKISINGAIAGWLDSIFSHQKQLEKSIDSFPNKVMYLDLENADKAEVLKILTACEYAKFEDNELIYEFAVTEEEVNEYKADAKRQIEYFIKKINKAINANKAIYGHDNHRDDIKAYLERHQKQVEGLDL